MPLIYFISYFDLNQDNAFRREYFLSKKQAAERSVEVKSWVTPDSDVFYDGKVYGFRYTNIYNLLRELNIINDPENCEQLEFKTSVKF